ncbi:hypothetical protein [Georgenia sp. TF02-10]
MSLYMMVFMGTTPIGSPLVGWVAEQFGPRWSVGVGAIASVLVAAAAAVWVKRSWHVEVHYSLLHRPHLLLDGPAERNARRASARRAERAERDLVRATLGGTEAEQGSQTA